MANKKERPIEQRKFEVRASESDDDSVAGVLEGYAIIFDQRAKIPYSNGGSFYEVVSRNAVNKTLDPNVDVFAFWNHDSGEILGRRKNNSLDLEIDETGLRFKITPPNTTRGRETVDLVKNGYIDEMSFAFSMIKEDWPEKGKPGSTRTLKEIWVHELSPVPKGAYSGTSVSTRGWLPERIEEQAECHSDKREIESNQEQQDLVKRDEQAQGHSIAKRKHIKNRLLKFSIEE